MGQIVSYFLDQIFCDEAKMFPANSLLICFVAINILSLSKFCSNLDNCHCLYWRGSVCSVSKNIHQNSVRACVCCHPVYCWNVPWPLWLLASTIHNLANHHRLIAHLRIDNRAICCQVFLQAQCLQNFFQGFSYLSLCSGAMPSKFLAKT